MTTLPIKRALLSVSDKTGMVEFAQFLDKNGVQLISTGGTSQLLREARVPHQSVEEITGLPSMLDGRVKTLHPRLHGGILGKRDAHASEAAQHQISWIDLVVVNFYPFEKAVHQNKEMSWDEAVEFIDVGGPTMVRAAAKNFAWVAVVTSPADYADLMLEYQQSGGISLTTRQKLAKKAFALTTQYDAMIHDYFVSKEMIEPQPDTLLHLDFEKVTDLRYGENPHQRASAWQNPQQREGVLSAIKRQGKTLSYNNILDADAAFACVSEFSEPACVIVKHGNPCGAATAGTIEKAYELALQTDTQSAFGGIVALNQPCTKEIAQAITSIFMEVIIAPDYAPEVLTLFANKPNLRVLQMPIQPLPDWEMRYVTGGVLLQEKDKLVLQEKDLQVMTKAVPHVADITALLFAWRVLKQVKSNAIVLAKNNAVVGIGAGQVSRIDAVQLAVSKAGERAKDAVLASDAFFPFRDSIDKLANTGVRAIIQPGGSLRDEEVIAACNELGIAMVFTGKRCFKH